MTIMRKIVAIALIVIMVNAVESENPYLAYMNANLLTIYIRRKFLEKQDVLEHAEEIN